MDSKQILAAAIQKGVEKLKEEYVNRGYTPGSSVYKSIAAAANSIVGNIPMATLFHGRKPGRYPPWGISNGTKSALMEWTQKTFGVDEKAAKGISYLIARKLKEQGSNIWQGKADPLPSEEIVQAVVKEAVRLCIKNVDEALGRAERINKLLNL